MKIPKTIRHNGFTYTVKLVKRLSGGTNWGFTDMVFQTIEIESDIIEEHQYQTFLHELIHIAYRSTAYKQLTDEQEENIVKPWAHNIYGILKDNGLLKK